MSDQDFAAEHALPLPEKVTAILTHTHYIRRAVEDHGRRLADLETFANRAKGVLAVIGLVVTVAGGAVMKMVLGV